jgi:CRISPR-associated protein Cas1
MRKLLNTLYVTTQGASLHRDGETVSVQVEKETKMHVPIHLLDGVVCLGAVFVTPPLMSLCAERNVTITYLSEQGRFLARVQGRVSGNVLLRRQQYRMADDPSNALKIAKSIVTAKVANARIVLMRCMRDHPEAGPDGLSPASAMLGRNLDEIPTVADLDSLRGKEGEAAQTYFGVFDHLITAQKEDFRFVGRSRRPPLDNINALLSFIYTLLCHDFISALETVGLDPAVGYLHADRPGRPSLALDLMEEFRPYLADRLVLSLVNRQQVNGGGFTKTESGGVLMDEDTKKGVITAYQKRKQEEVEHPFIKEKVQIGNLPFVQSMLFARFIRGDLDGYPPFFWR